MDPAIFFDKFDIYSWGFLAAAMLLELSVSLWKKNSYYEFYDTLTNIFFIFVHYGIIFFLTYFLLGDIYNKIHENAIFVIKDNPETVAFGIIIADFALYWVHFLGHRVLWPFHHPHHSSLKYNISTGLRQSWVFTVLISLLCLPFAWLGFSFGILLVVLKIVFAFSIYVHTQYIRKLPSIVEFIFVTPSHHRVHHASNANYEGKNLAGLFIIWDRIFGTFAEENDPPIFGVRKPVFSRNPFVLQFRPILEYILMRSSSRKNNQ